MPRRPDTEDTEDTEMNLSELDELREKSSAAIWDLFVKAINIYADPMKNAEDDGQKRNALKAAIEQISR